jgi:predicted nucleotidyltransferase
MTIDSFAASGNPEGPLQEICRRFLAAFPDRIRGIHLLGSRALGCAIPSSDVDLAIVFRGTAESGTRQAAQDLAAEIRRSGPLVLELTVLDEAEARQGVRPNLKIGRLLAGEDALRDSPLKPKEELLGYFAYSPLYFSWVIRGRPPRLRHPLTYPNPAGEFFGYEQNGIWSGEKSFRPGLGLLINLAASIANFRLALEAGEFVPNKSLTVAAYRKRFPADPLGEWLREVFELCRQRWQGAIPTAPGDRPVLADLCRRALAFENDSMGRCLLELPQLASVPSADLKERIRGILKVVQSDSAAHAAALASATRGVG